MTDEAPKIDVDDEESLRHWAAKFDASREQIVEAVQKVGASSADVEMHLKGSHATTNADQEKRGEDTQ